MNRRQRTVYAAIGLLALAGGAAAAPKAGHQTAAPANHAGPPPASNKQSAPDADRGMDRAGERRSEESLEHFRAEEQRMEHAPDRGADHRNAHSMQPHGKDGKHLPN